MPLEAWRSALAATRTALARLEGTALVEAKAELAAVLVGVSDLVQRQGGDPLFEAVLTDGICAAQGECSADDVRKIFAGLEVTRCSIEVDEADPGNGQIAASACGSWSAWGQPYSFRVAVTETSGAISGEVYIGGVEFSSSGTLDSGNFDTTARDKAVADWMKKSNAKVAAVDVLRIFIVVLEALARKNAEGIADIDVLGVAFGLMRHEAGMLKDRTWAEVRSSCTTGLCSLRYEDGPSIADPSDEQKCSKSKGKTILDMLDEPISLEDNSVAKSPSSAHPESISEEDAADEEVHILNKACDENVADNGNHDVKESPHSIVADEREQDLKESDDENVGDEGDHSLEESDEEDDGEMVFVCKAAFDAVVSSFNRGVCPGKDELVRLCDVSAVPEDAEVTPIDFGVLADGFGEVGPQSMSSLVDAVGVAEVVKRLVHWHSECAASDEEGTDKDDDAGATAFSGSPVAECAENPEKRARTR